MSQDYTFCLKEDCEDTTCYRHKSNIINPDEPHSFGNMNRTNLCPINNPEVRKILLLDFTRET